jgi:hypothetical protein
MNAIKVKRPYRVVLTSANHAKLQRKYPQFSQEDVYGLIGNFKCVSWCMMRLC